MILRFRGSDYRRSLSSTWYDMMDRWIETLPRVKWVPTFKVEYRILGYVDELTIELMEDVWDIVLKPESKNVVSSKWT